MSVRTMQQPGGVGALGNGSISQNEIISELNNRGYTLQVTAEPVIHVPHVTFTLSRAQAIMIAVDSAIEGYGLPRGYTHPFVCPSSGCPVEPGTWNAMIPWAVDAANGLLDGRYGLPPWFKIMMDINDTAGLGSAYGLGGFSDWLTENALVVSAIGAALSFYGQYLTTRQAKEAIESSIPKNLLTKENMPALLKELERQGKIVPGTSDTLTAGANAAATPDWIWPVVIGAGVLVVFMMIKR